MKKYSYTPHGVCSVRYTFELDDNGAVHNLTVDGGCSGNLQGICRLAEGQKAATLVSLLKGIDCGGKGTSCPDQIARALEKALASA